MAELQRMDIGTTPPPVVLVSTQRLERPYRGFSTAMPTLGLARGPHFNTLQKDSRGAGVPGPPGTPRPSSTRSGRRPRGRRSGGAHGGWGVLESRELRRRPPRGVAAVLQPERERPLVDPPAGRGRA